MWKKNEILKNYVRSISVGSIVVKSEVEESMFEGVRNVDSSSVEGS